MIVCRSRNGYPDDMSSILDVPSFRARVSQISVEEYHCQPEYNVRGRRTELIRGVVIEKMRKSPLHVFIASRLFKRIYNAVGGSHVVNKDGPLTFRDSEPEPDISVVAGHRDDFLTTHPSTALLVVEVAVPCKEEDQELAALYAEAGVAEYWSVQLAERRIEVHRQPESGRYREMRLYTGSDILECGSVVGVRVGLSELFAGL
jgi:Uma2 family endonuclease